VKICAMFRRRVYYLRTYAKFEAIAPIVYENDG